MHFGSAGNRTGAVELVARGSTVCVCVSSFSCTECNEPKGMRCCHLCTEQFLICQSLIETLSRQLSKGSPKTMELIVIYIYSHAHNL
jgi:hypothetical protein